MQPPRPLRSPPLLHPLLAFLVASVFVVDLSVPLGTAVWVVFLVPVVLAFLGRHPAVPLITAATVTVAVIAGFLVDRPGIDPEVARINRTLGAVTVWVLAAAGWFFVRNRLALQRESWLQTAQAELAAMMVSEPSLTELGERVADFLADRLGAPAAVVFARAEGGFVRLGSTGVPADAAVPERFGPDDGLLGAAVRRDRAMVVTDVPEGYLSFGSALGRAKPRAILAAPLHADGRVNGVVELACDGGENGRNLELMRRVAADIGASIAAARYRARLQELLETTQQQAEELQVQTEELTAANEELNEQSRVLQDSQTQMEIQQAEMEQTNTQLEEQTQLLESQRDELEKAHARLRDKADLLASASRYKSEFLANMSHELRTPLNALLIMARLLADNRGGRLSEEEINYARTIESSGTDLLALINDILDLAKIEAGKLDMRPDRVSPAAIVEKLGKTFAPQGADKGIAVRAAADPGLPEEIETDPLRLEQVLKNFLSNAIKFTERGEVTIAAAPVGDGRVRFSVRDTGIGIAADQQEVIFEAFRQADGTINRKFGGTGLGLSISRELTALLGGEIGLESTPGAGSTFSLTLPCARRFDAPPAEAPRPPPPATPRPAPLPVAGPVADDRDDLAGGRLVLAIEDDQKFAALLVDLAHEAGFRCIVAGTAEDGIAAAREYLPEAVILDIGLPDHTGMAVLAQLKRDVRTRHIPVHVASVDDYTEAALAFGAASYMLKPVKREELLNALARIETGTARRLRRVLIVEDDAAQREGLCRLLESQSVRTEGAASAAEALDRLRAETYDCLVLDLSLPDASGLDMLERMHADEAFAFPPVIVYTARELSEDEDLRLRRYSRSIIIKGAKSPERLIDEVTLFLHQVVSDLPEQQRRMLAASLSHDAAFENRRILVVEDDVRNIYALSGILEPHGARIDIARNGQEALDLLETTLAPGEQRVDLVLMDVMMPVLDGLAATRAIRARPEFRSLPVLMLTAKAMRDDQARCLEAGANDYLAKPLDVDKLLSLARVWIRR